MDEPLPHKMVWASVRGNLIPGSLKRDGEQVSALILEEDGSETRVIGRDEPYSEMLIQADKQKVDIIFQGLILERGPGHKTLEVRILGPVTLTGKISEMSYFGGEEERISFMMTREIASPSGELILIPTGVNLFGPDAAALSGLRAGDRVSLQARHGEDGFLAVSPVTVLDD